MGPCPGRVPRPTSYRGPHTLYTLLFSRSAYDVPSAAASAYVPRGRLIVFLDQLVPRFVAAIARINVDRWQLIRKHAIIGAGILVEPPGNNFRVSSCLLEPVRRQGRKRVLAWGRAIGLAATALAVFNSVQRQDGETPL